jgi:hypothetical protein
MFVAFTTVQQILTEVSGAATEKEKASVITEAQWRQLNDH